MSRLQTIVVLCAALLLAGLYFGFDTVPKEREAVETKRAIEGESTDEGSFFEEARKVVPTARLAEIDQLEQKVAAEKIDSIKNRLMKALAGAWFEAGSPVLSAKVASEIAEMENTDAAWSVAGATWQIAGTSSKDETTRAFSGKRSIKAFENAVSLAPNEVSHQVNLASVYADFPPADNPMKAVLMLRELEAKNPTNPLVFNALGRLAIRTGQWDRAIARFEKTLSLDPQNRQATCLLVEAFRGAKQEGKALEMESKCAALAR